MERRIKEEEFKCACCEGIFVKGWSDEKAKKEAEENFGKPVDEWNDEAMVICDDCYQEMLPSKHPKLVKKAKKVI